MTRRNIVGLCVLMALLGIGGRIIGMRGLGNRFNARTASLAEPYTTEEAWIVNEVVSDIVEMSAVGSGRPVRTPAIRGSSRPDTYEVALAAEGPRVSVDLSSDLWSPDAFADVARVALPIASETSVDPGSQPVHQALLQLTAPVLVTTSQTASRALQANTRDAGAHEAAALVVGAFGLREATARTADARWALNRMTAHLAMASAARGQRTPGVDGRLAEIVRLTLTNHQARALVALERLADDVRTDAVAAWTRAIRMRIVEDWRELKHPRQATRLEQREYFRARRATVRTVLGTRELEEIGLPLDIDAVRIIQASSVGVEDGALVYQALELERAELDDVYMRLHNQPLVGRETEALNAPASRAVSGDVVQVLPWGAWAEFAQRHMAIIVGRADSHLRHSVGLGHEADSQKLKLKADFGDLWVFPSATIWWTKGPNGKEADLRYIDDAILEAVARPHRLPAKAWSFLEFGSKYEPVRQAMPPAGAWYFRPAPRTAYDVAARVADSGHTLSVEELEALVAEAPYDWKLVSAYLTRRFGAKTPVDEVMRRAGERMKYDTRPVAAALALLGDDDKGLPILEVACGFAVGQCLPLGSALARRGRDREAARAYEAALADPALDAVAKANWSGWLVEYYRSQGQLGPALKLAEEAAATGASVGLVTAARLHERLGRTADAERLYQRNDTRYDAPAELIGFYYRALNERQQPEYRDAFDRAVERVFPSGLNREPLAAQAPSFGVFVETDSAPARAAGIQAGDIVLAVDGWHVENFGQYRAARALTQWGKITLTIWRAGLKVVEMPNRGFMPEFYLVNYPVQGWIEK